MRLESIEVTDSPAAADFELALLSDIGTNRENNEDSCGHLVEGPGEAVLVVADGVGGYEGGEVASRMAVDVTLETYHDSAPSLGPAKRLYRAVQRANIEIHNKALAVPELRRMATTLTAAVLSGGMLHAVHCGDCRLYLVRGSRIQQMTKDHTVIGERVRMGMLSEKEGRRHPDRSALSRCIGRELIASLDRLSMPLRPGDRIIVCTDGLYGVLEDHDLEHLCRGLSASEACRRLIDEANARGTGDNLTAAFLLSHNGAPDGDPRGWGARLRSLLRFGR